MDTFFFDGWQSLLRVFIVGVLAYIALIFVLRIAGKRTLSKMNAFDFVVTVALGSTLATVLLSKDVSLADGVLALSLLVGLQFAVTWTGARFKWVRHIVTGEASLLMYDGAFLRQAMKKTRIAEDEIRAAVRSAGMHSLANVHAVVLETDGSMTVISKSDTAPDNSSLASVRLPPDAERMNLPPEIGVEDEATSARV